MVHKKSNTRRTTLKALLPLRLLFFLAIVTASADSQQRFERSYTTQHPAHLTISNVNGFIHISSWDRKNILARASASSSVYIEDHVAGDDITISTKRNLRLGRADFDVTVPADTSLTIKNIVGKIDVRGITGHVSIHSIDSDVQLTKVNSPSVDVIVTSGDIYFDGELREGGSYSLQSMKGDLDVTLPSATSFNLNARALSENINLGSFLNSLSGSSRGPKGVSGTYLKGGPRLTLTAYAGRILLHKK
jgi:DUF4097 and DUF4098 domain-containing protein YvlB